MNFEKKMKKHIDQTLNEVVPNPYPVEKKHSFPRLFKVLIPVKPFFTSISLIDSISASIILSLLPEVLVFFFFF